MSLILKEKVTGPAIWRGSELADDQSWLYQLSDATLTAIEQALVRLKANGLTFPHFSKDDFPIHSLQTCLLYTSPSPRDS